MVFDEATSSLDSRSEQAIEAAGHGLFTDHLLAALSGAADINSDGYITATEIYATVRPSITQQSYSRQTPQFGYIEGNGDIVFLRNPPPKNRSFILIDTRIAGVDVWAGTSEIGHRLAVGRHRLPANAGLTTIIVKKGGQTLYREQVLLQENQVFPIRIAAGEPAPQHREAFSKLTIANRSVEDYSNSMVYDLDSDGQEEIITASGHRLYAFKADGSTLWMKKFNFPITIAAFPTVPLGAWSIGSRQVCPRPNLTPGCQGEQKSVLTVGCVCSMCRVIRNALGNL